MCLLCVPTYPACLAAKHNLGRLVSEAFGRGRLSGLSWCSRCSCLLARGIGVPASMAAQLMEVLKHLGRLGDASIGSATGGSLFTT
jgi:hypothetical protein